MYSLLIAMTVISGIAVVNLFLGFSAAMLLGRGPKSLRDIDRRIEFRTFSAHLLFVRARKRQSNSVPEREISDPIDAHSSIPEAVEPIARSSISRRASPMPTPTPTRKSSNVTTGAAQSPIDNDLDSQPPETVLSEQLRQWQTEEDYALASSAAILSVLYPNKDSGGEADEQLMQAIHKVITDVLRPDRKVLTFANQEFIWLNDDTSVEDAVMPTERIRQKVTHTRFDCGEQTTDISVATGITAVTPDDTPFTILDRLRAIVAAAQQNDYSTTVIDSGHGPTPTEPLELGIEEEAMSLSGAV